MARFVENYPNSAQFNLENQRVCSLGFVLINTSINKPLTNTDSVHTNFLPEDMARFVENYPEFRKKSGNVSKHVSLMSELSRIVDERILMSVSQIEQDLACTASQATAFEEVRSNGRFRLIWKQWSCIKGIDSTSASS